DATLARVTRLEPSARAVVEAAAILGLRVPFGLLREVAPHEDAALEAALERGVLVGDGGDLVFRHELTRQAIEESISPVRARELHARVLAVLAGDEPARLAHHAERAGLREDAARYAAQAAAEAERVGALAEASAQLKRTLRAELPSRERFELLLRYARATNFSGGLERARAAAEEAVALAQADLDESALGRALVVLVARTSRGGPLGRRCGGCRTPAGRRRRPCTRAGRAAADGIDCVRPTNRGRAGAVCPRSRRTRRFRGGPRGHRDQSRSRSRS